MTKRVILIGGMPTAGKSTIAAALAKHFDLPWISTDQIRTIMQSVASRADYPLLFDDDGMTVEEYFATFTNEQIAQNEFNQAKEVWAGIVAFIDENWDWHNGFVVEGVNITPGLVRQTYGNDPEVKALFISDTDTASIEKVVYERGLFKAARDYSDSFKPREVEWVKIIDTMIRDDAASSGYSVVDVAKGETDMDKLVSLLS